MEFTESEYYQEKFTDITLNNESIDETIFEECHFSNCTFIEVTFKQCRFIDCTFENCSMSVIKPEQSRFVGATFSHSKLLSFDWSLTYELRDTSFDHCQLDYSNFSMLKLPKLVMTNCIAKGVFFEDVDLSEADFSNTNLEEALFFKANLEKANFTTASNYSIDPKTNRIKGARFSYPEVMTLLNNLDIIIE